MRVLRSTAAVSGGSGVPGPRLPVPAADRRTSHRDREALAATAAVALLLAGGRWISYLPVGFVYIGDALLAVAAAHAVFSRLLLGPRAGATREPGPAVTAALLVALLRLLAVRGDLHMAARDAAPFVYIAVAYLSARAYCLAGEANRRRTVRLLHAALVVHLVRVAIALLAPGLAPGLAAALPALGDTNILEIRSDLDTALLGVLAGLSITRFRRGTGAWRHGLTALACLALALGMQSRAGLLACGACTVAALLLRPARKERTSARTALLAVTAALLLALYPASPAGERLLATVDSSATSQQIAGSAQGTAHAREMAWQRVVAYTLQDPARTLVGTGFGPDFLHQSRADIPLGGNLHTGVRAPHNYLLTCFARMGVAGLAAVMALLAAILAAAVRELRAAERDELAALAVFLVIALLVTALLGVILESPFGAVPFYWAAGILLARDRLRRAG